MAGKPLVSDNDVKKVRENIFKQLTPIKDDYVKISDFDAAGDRPEWTQLKYFLARTIELIQNHKLLKETARSEQSIIAKKDRLNLIKQLK